MRISDEGRILDRDGTIVFFCPAGLMRLAIFSDVWQMLLTAKSIGDTLFLWFISADSRRKTAAIETKGC